MLGSKEKNLHGYCTSSASPTTSGDFLLGVFWENLHDRYLYIPVKSARYFKLHFILRKCWGFQLNSRRQLGVFIRARSSQIPANLLWTCPCAERGDKLLLLEIPSGPVCGKKKIWEVQSALPCRFMVSFTWQRERKMNYLQRGRVDLCAKPNKNEWKLCTRSCLCKGQILKGEL